MAKIEFTGFVDEWTKNNLQHPDWAMRVVETHRKKDGDKWITASRTYRTIKAAFDVNIDFNQFTKDDMVVITGNELTETSERDGKTYNNLVVKADSVVLAAKISSGAATVVPEDDNPPF
jgi:hypothetical protein